MTSIKLRRGPANDNRDFEPVVRRAHAIRPIKIGIGDKGYDAEKNHELLRDELHAMSIIPARQEDVPVWRTRGRYRKEMKRGYSKKKYHQRSKDETIFSVVKRTMGDEVRSVRAKAQNNEMRFKIISYNASRIASIAHSLLRGFLQSRQCALTIILKLAVSVSRKKQYHRKKRTRRNQSSSGNYAVVWG